MKRPGRCNVRRGGHVCTLPWAPVGATEPHEHECLCGLRWKDDEKKEAARP